MRLKLILSILYLFWLIKPVYAGEPPTLENPPNNSTVTLSTLNWQESTNAVCANYDAYRVQIDDDPSFPSANIYRNTYTRNTTYTPQLPAGTWYWRVRARDETCSNWSDWSNTWSFTLTTSSPTPSSTQSLTPTPSLNPSPSLNPIPSPSPSIFSISNIPSQTNTDQEFNILVNFTTSDYPQTKFYLKGAFKKAGGSNYFGQTKVSQNWIKNNNSFSNQYTVTTDSSGNWSGNLEVKPDSEDSGFSGTGEYIFKVAKYTSSGSGLTWSNEVNIKIISTESGQDKTSVNAPSPTPSPSAGLTSSPKNKAGSPQPTPSTRLIYYNASVAGVASSPASLLNISSNSASTDVRIENQKQINPIILIGLIFIFAGVSTISYIFFKKYAKIHFKLR